MSGCMVSSSRGRSSLTGIELACRNRGRPTMERLLAIAAGSRRVTAYGRRSACCLRAARCGGWAGDLAEALVSEGAFPSQDRCRSLSLLQGWSPGRERSRQPEPRQHAGLEAGHAADPVAGQGEHVEAGRVADSGRAAQIGPERGLAVGSGRYEVEPAARAELAGPVAGHGVSALVSEWLRG